MLFQSPKYVLPQCKSSNWETASRLVHTGHVLRSHEGFFWLIWLSRVRLQPYVLIRVGNPLCRMSFTPFLTSLSWTLSFEHQPEQRDPPSPPLVLGLTFSRLYFLENSLCDICNLVFTALLYHYYDYYYFRLIGGQDVGCRNVPLRFIAVSIYVYHKCWKFWMQVDQQWMIFLQY